MERGKYIMTRRGQASALGKRRMRRVTVMLEQQPQSKNIKPADAEAYRRAILERLEKFGQAAFRGDVLLQMDFFTTAKDPPAIYSLPKNYIDLLWKHGKVPDGIRPRLLLGDDRQVKALIVRYHLRGLSGKPRVWLRAEPFRDFLADAHLVERISRDGFEEEERNRWRGSNTDDLGDGPFRGDEDCDDDGFQQLADLERDKTSFMRRMSNDAFESMRQMTRMGAHQGYLRRAERHTCSGVLYALKNTPASKREPCDSFLDRLAFQTRSMSLAPPFTLELPCAPQRKGEGEAFDRALREALESYKAKHRYLFPLATVLNVTVLIIPAKGGDSTP